MAKDKTEFEQIRDRLDLLAHLLCLLVDQNRIPSIGDQIVLLASHGLAPAEIGRIVGREANYVSASLKNKKANKKNG
jgi:hypothetical protein